VARRADIFDDPKRERDESEKRGGYRLLYFRGSKTGDDETTAFVANDRSQFASLSSID